MSGAIRSLLVAVTVGAAAGTTQRFHSGQPPHAGWWLTAIRTASGIDGFGWRWWSADGWSVRVKESSHEGVASEFAVHMTAVPAADIYWSHFYPANARVPRVDPRWPAFPSVNDLSQAQLAALSNDTVRYSYAPDYSAAALKDAMPKPGDPMPPGMVGWYQLAPDGPRHYITQAQKDVLLAKLRRGMPLSGHLVHSEVNFEPAPDKQAIGRVLRAAPTKAAFIEAVRGMSVNDLIAAGFLQRPSAKPAAEVLTYWNDPDFGLPPRLPDAAMRQEQAAREAKASAQATGSPVADVGAETEHARLLRTALAHISVGVEQHHLATLTHAQCKALERELARLREDVATHRSNCAKNWKAGYGAGLNAAQLHDANGHDPALMPHFQSARARMRAASMADESVQLTGTMARAMLTELAHLQGQVRTLRRDLIKATDEATGLRRAAEMKDDGLHPPITIDKGNP